VHQDAPQPQLDRRHLEQFLLVGGAQLHVVRHVVGQRAGLFHRPDEALDDLLGHAAVAAQLRGALADLAKQALEGRVFRIHRALVHQRRDDTLDVTGFGFRVVERRGPPFAFQQQLQAAGETLDLRDAADHPDVVQHIGARLVHVLALGDREDALHVPLAFQSAVDGPQRLVPPGDDRGGHAREHHRLAERQNRQADSLTH
jgi:hypothetical protein